jgi:hypothetical protein
VDGALTLLAASGTASGPASGDTAPG